MKEGTLYKRVEIEGVTFEIDYGYLTDEHRQRGWDAEPLYPDFVERPQYTRDGFPFANAYQDVCEHYQRKPSKNDDDWCDLCKLFEKHETYIGICRCEARRGERKNE